MWGSRREKCKARREEAGAWAPNGAVAEAGRCVLAARPVSSQSPGPCLCAGAGALEAATGSGQLGPGLWRRPWGAASWVLPLGRLPGPGPLSGRPGLPPGATPSWAEAWRVGDSQTLWG